LEVTVLTITLKPDVAEQIVRLIWETQTSADVIVDKAVRAYLEQVRREKVRAETEAFERQRDSLLAAYKHEVVAIHEGEVIDHDPNLRTLPMRVFARLGHTPVLLKPVTPAPERELVFRSPHFEREPS
jgi:hypothetical protein